MKKLFGQLFLVAVLVALYFISDFINKGQLLNSVLPIPVLGFVFWALLIYGIYDIILNPIFLFRKLTRYKELSVMEQSESICKILEKEKNELFWKFNSELIKVLPKESSEAQEREEKLSELISEYYGNISPASMKIIKMYSWKAALCVVFSRNNFIDGILMFFSQVKMAMELMRLYGYKLSPLFNICCFFWIASNSALNGIFTQATADSLGEIIGEMLSDGGFIEEGFQSKIASKASASLIEALTAATTIYVTGVIINRKLLGETKKLSISELFKIRRKGRVELIKDIPSIAMKNIQESFGE